MTKKRAGKERRTGARNLDDAVPEIDFKRCVVVRPDSQMDRRLATLRATWKVTQVQLAERAGITQSEVSRAELRRDCRVSTLERYAKALGGELLLYVRIDGRGYPITLGGGL